MTSHPGPAPATPHAKAQYANGVARRNQILAAALRLVATEGFTALSMRRIAAEAGLTTPGLLRHYADRDEILAALTAGATAEISRWTEREQLDLTDDHDLVRQARHTETRPGNAALFATIAGAAANPGHAAHESFRMHYEVAPPALESVIRRISNETGRALDASGEAVRLVAAWDGLQLQSLYEPNIHVSDELACHFAGLRGRPTGHRVRAGRAIGREEYLRATREDDTGYLPGRQRRTEITEQAMTLLARDGYHATTMQKLSDATGIQKSSIMHHYPTKEALLQAVLAHRDAVTVVSPTASRSSARADLFLLADAAELNEQHPGLIAVYSVLAGEAAVPNHPAHAYFTHRMERVRGYIKEIFQRLHEQGELAPGRDPDHEAIWMVALWDGLQLQWLYQPTQIDIAAQLREHIRSLLA